MKVSHVALLGRRPLNCADECLHPRSHVTIDSAVHETREAHTLVVVDQVSRQRPCKCDECVGSTAFVLRSIVLACICLISCIALLCLLPYTCGSRRHPAHTQALPFDKGHNDEIVKAFREVRPCLCAGVRVSSFIALMSQWEAHRSWEFLREALGVAHKDHSFVKTKFPEGVRAAFNTDTSNRVVTWETFPDIDLISLLVSSCCSCSRVNSLSKWCMATPRSCSLWPRETSTPCTRSPARASRSVGSRICVGTVSCAW